MTTEMLGDRHPEGGDRPPEGDHHLEGDLHQEGDHHREGEDPNPEGERTLTREEGGRNEGGLRQEDHLGMNQGLLNLLREHRQRGEEDQSQAHHQRGDQDLHQDLHPGGTTETDQRALKCSARNLS